MVYAVIATGGKQYRVEPGRFYDVEKLDFPEDSIIPLDQVLLVVPDGDDVDVLIGQPLVEGAIVRAKVLQHGRAKKVLVYKMRPKKHYRRKKGHRQPFTRLLVEAIELNGMTLGTQPVTIEASTEDND
ncbi:50S ribosomal protein L21 [Candidatus Cyanaurora vandensis]|uniref:50S ribosomal protein L21 n=1 Tax=Candidatus Cyanaurora vandensis TaxID=2714958 RepID=UPI00257CE487|nr:50S ribosomal protein L21 [Candidatus Cyanaurora vandensis]